VREVVEDSIDEAEWRIRSCWCGLKTPWEVLKHRLNLQLIWW